MYKLNNKLLCKYENGEITADEYYKQCVLNFYRKAPPEKNTSFQLKIKENTDVFARPQVQLGIEIIVEDSCYTLKCIYEGEEQFSVEDSDFYRAVDKLFGFKKDM